MALLKSIKIEYNVALFSAFVTECELKSREIQHYCTIKFSDCNAVLGVAFLTEERPPIHTLWLMRYVEEYVVGA